MAKSMELRVVSPEKTVFEGRARSVVVPAWDGRVGVLPGHAPLITLLGAGPLRVDAEEGGAQAFEISGGVLKVEGDSVTVLASKVGASGS
ncbi:MAG: ATP synthase F1 subunit epsilon [Longimicrobiales bacterium]